MGKVDRMALEASISVENDSRLPEDVVSYVGIAGERARCLAVQEEFS